MPDLLGREKGRTGTMRPKRKSSVKNARHNLAMTKCFDDRSLRSGMLEDMIDDV